MKEREFNIIAVDFDGTLCTDAYPEIGNPNIMLICLLKRLKEEGKRIILWTCRSDEKLEEAIEWCHLMGLEFDAVNDNVPETMAKYGNNSRKISADVYIDDRSCFPWSNNSNDYSWPEAR